ncbi:MAG: hypothetical protein ABI591_31075 [Kofleriaceae bacterium]
MKYVVIAVICLAACDLSDKTSTDRPETLAYITQTILKPSCGTAECHSAMKAQSNDVFDSVEAAQGSITLHGLIASCNKLTGSDPPCDSAAANSYLFTILSTGVTSTIGLGDRMPLDQALGNADIALIGNWIDDGATGYTFPVTP